ncbi:MAG: hypothetical protein ACJ75H_10090 [Thermoanaerobaculia bacterium]
MGDYWTIESVVSILRISRPNAIRLIEELSRRGLIESIKHGGESYWQKTLTGRALALATAAGGIKRRTADKVFSAFLERVEEVNNNPYYLYKVRTVVLFGSYLNDVANVGDIDLAIDLVMKESDPGTGAEMIRMRGDEAQENGRQFSTFMAKLLFANTEVWRFLKSRSRTLSLHNIHDPILAQIPYRVVSGNPAWRPEDCGSKD